MTNYLERDENYEPAVLPSPAELLHWGDLHSPPESRTPSVLPDDSEGFTRFVPQRRRGRIIAATLITVVLVALGAWGVGSLTMGSGVTGIAAYFKAAGLLALVGGVLWGLWRWARQPRTGGPRFL